MGTMNVTMNVHQGSAQRERNAQWARDAVHGVVDGFGQGDGYDLVSIHPAQHGLAGIGLLEAHEMDQLIELAQRGPHHCPEDCSGREATGR